MKKTKKNKSTKSKGLLFRFVSSIFRRKFKKYNIIGLENIPKDASLIIGNHAQMYGPLLSEIKFPYPRYTWCIGNVLKLKDAPSYILDDFWPNRKKGTTWFYKIVSYIISPVCVYTFTNADVIGVYKDTRIISTFKNTVQALKDNHHIIIFPEQHQDYNHIINEFQDKFIDVAKLYYKETGKELSFVPMYNAPKIKTVIYGKPIKFNSQIPIEEQRITICNYLKNEITQLAEGLPLHTVIPYANVKKKYYPKNKKD